MAQLPDRAGALGRRPALSQKKRKLVERVFGWAKLDRGMRQAKARGPRRVDWMLQLVAAAHNLRRMETLPRTA